MPKKDKDMTDTQAEPQIEAVPAVPAVVEMPVPDPALLEPGIAPQVPPVSAADHDIPRKPKDWEPPHIHVRKIKFDYVKLEPVGDGWMVVVGITSADDARTFYSSVHSHIEQQPAPPVETLGL